MALDNGDNGTDWSVYGPCESCGSVAGWPCHRGKRQLKNAHAGRPQTGQEPYAETPPGDWVVVRLAGRDPEDVIAGNDPRDAELIEVLAAEALPYDVPLGPTTKGPDVAMDPWGAAPAHDGPPLGKSARHSCGTWHPDGTTCPDPYLPDDTTTKEPEVAMDPAAEAADWTARLDNAERLPKNPSGKRRVDAEVPKDVDRDQYNRPKLVRAEQDATGAWVVPMFTDDHGTRRPIPELEGFTRASTLGNALEDSTGLNRWRGGMVAFGMSRRRDLVLAAQAIPGTEDKKRHRQPLYQIADAALEAAEASSAATVGTALHALTEQADAGTLTVDIGEYQSVLDIYLERMAGWRVVRSETFVVSDYFHAAGTFDRLITPLEPMALVDQQTGEIIAVIMPGDLVVVDLKTSTTADYFGAKFFAQLAVYVTGQLYDRRTLIDGPDGEPMDNPNYGARTPLGQRTDFALILHIPQGGDADGEPVAEWHWLDMRAGLALAQLACVVLETRKKRFTRTHMRPVLAVPHTPTGTGPVVAPTRIPSALPARDPLGSDHLELTTGLITETAGFPDDQADAVDAELAADGAPPEERATPPAALEPDNLGRLAAHASGEPVESRVAYQTEPDPDGIATMARLEHPEEETMPGPEETAPLPEGWESKAEQEQAAEDRMAVPPIDPTRLGPSLQAAAKLHAQEEALIRRIGNAENVAALVELHQKATAHGLWTDRVKASASARKAQLKARAS